MVLWVPPHAAAQTEQTGFLLEALRRHIWSWESPAVTTRIIFKMDGTLLTMDKKTWRWLMLDPHSLRVTMESNQSVDLTFDPAFSSFRNTTPSSTPVTGKRLQPLATTNASPGAVGAPARTPDPLVMTLAQDWMPDRIHTRKGEINSIEFFSRLVVDKAPPGKETIPTTIWGPLKWLMPVKEAIKTLPANSRLQRNHTLENLWFPQDSLHLWTMAMVGVEADDRCNKFNYVQFICDRDDRLIGLQMIHTRPPFVAWKAPGPDGVSVPYYNFVMDTWNASRSQCVPYQVQSADKGVILIKTALYDSPTIGVPPYAPGPCPGTILLPNRKYLESVHWYLTAPLAAKILEIVEDARIKELKGGRLGGGGLNGGGTTTTPTR